MSNGNLEIVSFSSDSKRLDTKVIDKNIVVELKVGSDYHKIEGSDVFTLTFVRESGAFNKCIKDDVAMTDYCTEIRFTKGDKVVELRLATYTGKVTYK